MHNRKARKYSDIRSISLSIVELWGIEPQSYTVIKNRLRDMSDISHEGKDSQQTITPPPVTNSCFQFVTLKERT